jgi:hypothetical protein
MSVSHNTHTETDVLLMCINYMPLFTTVYNATEAVSITSRSYLQEYITLQKRYKN